jgi:hypothetical protein
MGALFAGAFSFPFPFVLRQRAAFPHRSISVVTFPFIPHLAGVSVPVHPAPRRRFRFRSSRTSHAACIGFRTSAQFCKFVKNVRFCLFFISL